VQAESTAVVARAPRHRRDVAVIAIFGSTASGKSAVAEAIAERVPAELVSADAMQAYRGLPILTNQSTYPTHLTSIWELDHEGSVGEYQELAHAAIDGVLDRGRTPVVVGGTGLYLRAALSELDLPPAPAPGARERWNETYDRLGSGRAHALLAGLDAPAAEVVHPNDRRRVVRALELAEEGYSLRPGENRLWTDATRHATLVVGLDVPAGELERRIVQRTRAMLEAGVADEARRALAGPLSTTAGKVIGLRELVELPEERAFGEIVRRTMRYAAYQRKWMRRVPGLELVDGLRPAPEAAAQILRVAQAA
jgi:tRNA dimethylallyltransferase